MNLEKHIQRLLLDNDCVIIPGIGGFIAHDIPACYDAQRQLFMPPTRMIGFNTKLTVNDGLLIHSVMKEENLSYEEAARALTEMCRDLSYRLHQTGEYRLSQVGTLHMNIRGALEFKPDAEIANPAQWGFQPFHLDELSTLAAREQEAAMVRVKATRKTYEIRINRTFIHTTIAAAAAIILLFVLSTPIKNTYVEKDNYAQLMSVDLFEKIEYRSMNVTPIRKSSVHRKPVLETVQPADSARQIVVREIKVKNPETTEPAPKPATKQTQTAAQNEDGRTTTQKAAENKPGAFHIIVAGGISEATADKTVRKLQADGHGQACKIQAPGHKFRVSICSFGNRAAAEAELNRIRMNSAFKDAWLLVNK